MSGDLLSEEEIRDLTDLKQPAAQARKLRELQYVVIGFSARGKVRALKQHPLSQHPEDRVVLNFG